MLLFIDVQCVHIFKCYQRCAGIHLHNFLKSIEDIKQYQNKLIVPHDVVPYNLISENGKEYSLFILHLAHRSLVSVHTKALIVMILSKFPHNTGIIPHLAF